MHKADTRLGLKGVPAVQLMETLGHQAEKHEATLYELTIWDNEERPHNIKLLGMEKITSKMVLPPDLSQVYKLFPHVPPDSLHRLRGEVNIMLGLDVMVLQPVGGEDSKDNSGNLHILHIKLGSGFILGGSHEGIPSLLPQIPTRCATRVAWHL